MVLTKTLYHPRFEPSESWLRAMLLFYDTVHSIVPEGAEYAPSPGVATLMDKSDGAFVPLSPTDEDRAYDWPGFDALSGVLRNLPDEPGGRERVRLEWEEGVPNLDFGGAARVHTDKMGDVLAQQLLEQGLAEQTEDEKWLRVDRRVAGLVLSLLAERMARNRPGILGTASDRQEHFAVAARSELKHGEPWNPEATIASAILMAEIPADIVELPVDRYLEIRARYADKRETFRLAMDELRRLYFQGSFEAPGQFEERVREIVEGFDGEMRKLKEGRLAEQVRRWAPIAIGGVVSLAAAAVGTPAISMAAGGTAVLLEVVKTAQGQPVRGSYVAQSQALLVGLQRDLRWNRSWLGRVFTG